MLTGETVIVSYVSDPSLGYGRFRLENKGSRQLTAAVESAWLELGERQQPLGSLTVFDVDHDRNLDPNGFDLAPGASLTFLLSFPTVPYQPPFGESTAVGLRLSADHTELQALSPIRFERRIPR